MGRIDRIDYDLNKDQHIVVDYKKRATPEAKGYKDGRVLQAPLYMLAARTLGFNCELGLYRSIEKQEGKIANAALARQGKEASEKALGCAFSFPGEIREGRFPPLIAHSHSGEWPFYYCGIEIARSRSKQSGESES